MKLAVLDDYQRVALQSADWSALKGVQVKVYDAPFASLDEAARKLKPFDVLCLMRERMPFPRKLVEKLPNLKFVSLTGRRAGSLDAKALAERGIPVSHTGAGNGTASTVELTWGLILAAARNLEKANRNMRSGKWHQALPPGMALGGKRLGLIGAGGIGAKVGAVARAFGMDVVAWSQNLTAEKAAAAGVRHVSKDELLSSSAVMSIHLVLSDRTRGLISKNDFQKMKSGAILVNTSRGPLVDEKALLAWLKSGKGHAALDVYDREPLPAKHPLRKLDNVTLSPHLGYVNEENYRTFYRDTAENVAAWMAGNPIRILQP
ncbi:MAG TPA: D-2-hydroxyacid dehydrogenase family protein [Burkholderiales bacterium]